MPEHKLATAEIVARTLHRYLGENWGEDQEGAALAVVEALRAAGRLLPEGGETRTEWGCEDNWPPGRGWQVDPVSVTELRNVAERYAAMYSGNSEIEHRLVRHEVRDFPDRSIFTGPWVAVDQEATDG